MSYDLDLYTAKAPNLAAPDAGDGAIFHVEPSARCADEDIAPDYLDLLGKRRRWLTRLHIEGRPDAQALAAFEAWLAETIALTDGMLIDEQAGRVQSRTSNAPLPDADRKAEPRLGRMSFFFEDVEAFHSTGLARVLDIVARVLPEAMPARFGRWEPLQGQVTDGDVSLLLAEFAIDPELFLKAKTPFAHIYMNIPCEAEMAKWHPAHVIRSRFLAGTLAFELRPKALEDPRLVTHDARDRPRHRRILRRDKGRRMPGVGMVLARPARRSGSRLRRGATLYRSLARSGRAWRRDRTGDDPRRADPVRP